MPPTRGLIIGKFMPPHAGHQFLIDTAHQQCARLDIVLFSKSAEPIPGATRAAWMRELYPEAVMHHLHLDHRVDFDDPAAWEFWVRVIQSVLAEPPDVVFSSEAYGDELARRLGARHSLVDAARRQVPISATQIRARPMTLWGYLPAPVRPYFVRRVCVLGAESTGKTTLARALAERFQTAWVPEYAREYLTANGNQVTRETMLVIARGQAEAEERLARQANRVLVTDTNLLTTQLWHERYFGEAPAALRAMADQRRADLYLVCGTDVPWVSDGLRDSPELRDWFTERFCAELRARGLPFVVVTGPPEERLRCAASQVEALLRD